jgi:DNA modification methylase
MPSRFAIEMCNRGWILRNLVVWHKPNCIPSSANDRFTVDFEYLYFFTRNRNYFFEQQLEVWTDRNTNDIRRALDGHKQYSGKWRRKDGRGSFALPESKIVGNPLEGRNKRCVWNIPTQPFPEAHFAVFPEKLVLTPMQAGCPQDVCVRCGRPKRLIKKVTQNPDAFNIRVRDVKEGRIKFADRKASDREVSQYREKEYRATERERVISEGCECGAGFRRGIVLDPFAGSGTTCMVAKRLGRDFIGIDISERYCEMARKRLEVVNGES